MNRPSGKKKKKVVTDVGSVGQQEDQLELDDETFTEASDQPAAHATMTHRDYDAFTVVTLRSQLRKRNLSDDDAKPTLVT